MHLIVSTAKMKKVVQAAIKASSVVRTRCVTSTLHGFATVSWIVRVVRMNRRNCALTRHHQTPGRMSIRHAPPTSSSALMVPASLSALPAMESETVPTVPTKETAAVSVHSNQFTKIS